MQLESWDEAVKRTKAEAKADAEAKARTAPVPPPLPTALHEPNRARSWWRYPWAVLGGLVAYPVLAFVVNLLFFSPSQPGSVVRLHQVALAAPAVAETPRVTTTEDRYRVLKADGDSAKDVIHVRLASKFEMPALREIARSVRDQWSTGKERMVLWFYQPEVDRDPVGYPFAVQAWAFGDFDGPIHGPGLAIDIRGLTTAEEVALLKGAVPPADAEVVGRWLEDGLSSNLFTIYRRGGTYFLRRQSSPGSGVDAELVVDGDPVGKRFRGKEFLPGDDRYVINDRDDFEIRNDNGAVIFARWVDR